MQVQLTAFYESLQEMKSSYSADLQMINNYARVVTTDSPASHDHIGLLKSQLQLMIETIEEMIKRK